MKDIWISELERIFKRRKTIVGIVIYLLLVGFECLFLGVFGVSFYNPNESVPLNNINTAPFFLRELGIFLIFILIPMFVVDSFNGEYSSGALRLILLRPQERYQIFIVKWSIQAIILLGLLGITWAIATIFGFMVFPEVTETTFFHTGSFQPLEAIAYGLIFYTIAFLILLSVISIGSLMSLIMPNAILSYVGIIGFLVGSIYISDHFTFFLSLSDSIFEVLSGLNSSLIILVLLIIAVSSIININVWKKRDWMG